MKHPCSLQQVSCSLFGSSSPPPPPHCSFRLPSFPIPPCPLSFLSLLKPWTLLGFAWASGTRIQTVQRIKWPSPPDLCIRVSLFDTLSPSSHAPTMLNLLVSLSNILGVVGDVAQTVKGQFEQLAMCCVMQIFTLSFLSSVFILMAH